MKFLYLPKGVLVNTMAAPKAIDDRPFISLAGLIIEMHTLLLDMRNENGVIITGKTAPFLLKELHEVLSERYRVRRVQVNRAFYALSEYGLRGDAARLRKTGMPVYETSEALELLQSIADKGSLRQAHARVEALELQAVKDADTISRLYERIAVLEDSVGQIVATATTALESSRT